MAGVPGKGGPVPKRSDERIRRNKPETPVEKIEIQGDVVAPGLGLVDPHPMIVDFYASLRDSAQAKFYEPSDWQFARVTMHFLDQQVKSSRPSGQTLATLSSMLTELLVSEGSRRRVRLEVERNQVEAQVFDVADRFKQMLGSK